MIANLSKFLVILAMISPVWLQAGGPSESFDRIGELHTATGDHYANVEIIQVDPNGLIFRHSRGMAKVVFDDLSPAFRERFGYDPESAAEFVKVKEPTPTARPAPRRNIKTIIVLQPPSPCAPCLPVPVSCGYFLPYPHALAQFPYRRMVELDFLYTAGIIPRPPGVYTRRIW